MTTNFPQGVSSFGVPVMGGGPNIPSSTGNYWFVDSGSTLGAGDGTASFPMLTLATAITAATASNGDVIVLMPGHAETISAAAGIDVNKAGLTIVGIGEGALRPTFTFGTATTASLDITASNTSLTNVIGVAGIDALTKPFNVTGDNVTLEVEWRDASATVEAATAVRLDTANNANLTLKYNGFTAGNATTSAVLLDDCDNVIINIDGYGVVSTAWVNMVDVASTNVTVNGTMYTQGITNFTRDVVDTITGSTWSATIFDASAGFSVSGGSAAALASDDVAAVAANVTTIKGDVGGVDSATNVLGADDADNQFASTNVTANRDGSVLERLEQIIAAQADDVATNALGFDDSNNAFASSSVVANVDGSVLERLEALMDPLGGYDPVLGFRVTKTGDAAAASGLDDLFTVTGRCLITHFSGEVTTQLATVTTIKISDTTNTVDLCAATTVTNDIVGTMYALPSLSAEILNGTGGTPVVGSVPGVTIPVGTAGRIVGDVQAALTLQQTGDQVGTGQIAWVLYYKPLTAASSIVAAA